MKKLLIVLSALGLAAAALTSSDIFAPSTDSTTAREFGVSSNPRLRAVDLQMATYNDTDGCGTYAEDLTLTRSVSFTATPRSSSEVLAAMCLKNNGSAAVALQVTSRLLSQNDLACTGDEADYDVDCGVSGTGDLNNPLGLSSPVLLFKTAGASWECASILPFSPDPRDFTSGCNSFTSLPANTTMILVLGYQTAALGPSYTEADFQRAQSDSVLFELEFEGSVA